MLLIICVGVCARVCVCLVVEEYHILVHKLGSNTFCCTQSQIIYSNTIIIKAKTIIVNVYEYFISSIIMYYNTSTFEETLFY